MQDEDALREVAKDCVHCGFCLPACPTYQLWGEEMDSPRGRIYLVNQILDGAELSETARLHFDRCLGCMTCMTACPSGVQYDQLIEAARVWAEQGSGVQPAVVSKAPGTADESVAEVRGADAAAAADDGSPGPPSLPPAGKRSARERAERAAIFSLFPYPKRLRAMTAPLRVAQRTGLDRRLARSRLPGRVSPVLGAALRLAPPGATAADARPLPGRVPALGARRAVVGMLTGCVQSVFFPRVNAATARVLAAEGCDVIIPREQGCCGALSMHAGREAEAETFARRTIATFEQAGVDAVVVNSAGCGSAMKEYERLLRGADGGWAERAAEMSGKVRDLAEFLADLGPVARRHPLPVTAAYHDACHLAHAQRITKQPRELLRAIPGLNLVEVADAGNCCGSAGVYNLLQPEAASELGARKAESVLATGAPLLISANPGCSLQIASALAARGQDIAVAHTAEVLDASIRGRPL
ncbi:MAG TPA: heterodisulfide reductase-related iron-sulfur binding cluster [Streptosporangiaceae bacterium]|nr:heterodisulfide reductase-related iron-sulfur binding cluster [Streptosporangiaceae bacterium]